MASVKLDIKKPDATGESKDVLYWLNEISTATEREKHWSTKALEVVKIYEADKKTENSFNILYSNTETLLPALYSNCPIPVVKRRYADKDPVAKISSMVLKRALQYEQDNNLEDSYTFDDMMEAVVLDALIPGRGVVRLKIEQKNNKPYVCRECVPWERFRHGYGRTWASVPWVSFEHWLTEEEIKTQFGETFVKKVTFVERIPVGVKPTDDEASQESENKLGKIKLACVYEIWDKQSKTVYFVSEKCETFLKKVADPLNLSGFFPTPKPLIFYKRVSGQVPVPVYCAYEEQAEELNRISNRINKLIEIMKVRGFYDSTLEQLATLMTLEDGQFTPLDNVASFRNGDGAIPDAFWFMPIQELIAVLQQLYIARESVKQVIYEITGIADILRGASSASETATAQSIKDKWGSLRIKRWQKMVSVYARDLLRLMAELTAEHLSAKELSSITLVQLPSDEDKKVAQAELQQAAIAQQQGQQVPPEILQKLQASASAVSWGDVEKLIKSDYLRSYSIDIETNTTLDVEASDDKEQMAEFMNALSQFLNGIGPMVEKGAMSAQAANEILKIVARKYRFGSDIEEYLQVEDGAGGQAKVEELTKQNEDLQNQLKQAQDQLQQAQLSATEQKYAQQAEAKVAKVVAKASEDAIIAKVQLMLEQHQSKVKDMVHLADKENQKVTVENLAEKHKELIEMLQGAIASETVPSETDRLP